LSVDVGRFDPGKTLLLIFPVNISKTSSFIEIQIIVTSFQIGVKQRVLFVKKITVCLYERKEYEKNNK